MAAPYPPREPPPSSYALGPAHRLSLRDLVGIGADLLPGTLLLAYRSGLFPMGVGDGGQPPIGWWSPRRRGVLLPGTVHVSRSLRRSLRTFEVGVDTAFAEVVAACADPDRDGRWITPDIQQAYQRLHELGWAHSIEVRRDGDLVGGLYGVAVGGLFAGESMFHRVTDASKAAMVHLDHLVSADGDGRRIIDVQWATPHLTSMGVRELSRGDYQRRLQAALTAPELDVAAAEEQLRRR